MTQQMEAATEVPNNIPIQIDVLWLAKQKQNAAQVLNIVQGLTISNQSELEIANQWTRSILQTVDMLEEQRTAITKPILDGKRGVDKLFTDVRDPFQRIASLLKSKIVGYFQEEKRKQAEAFAEAQQAHQQGDQSALVTALNTSSRSSVEAPQGTSIKEQWQAEIVNGELLVEACLINRAFLAFIGPNLAVIAAHAKATPIDREPGPIPGVRFIKVGSATVRR